MMIKMEGTKNHRRILVLSKAKTIILLLLLLQIASCSTAKISRHSFSNRFLITSIVEDYPEKNQAVVLNTSFKQDWESFSMVKVSFSKDTILLKNIYPRPNVKLINTYNSDRYSITFVDKYNNIIYGLSHSLVLNDSVFVSSKYNNDIKTGTISKVKLTVPNLDYSYLDTLPKNIGDSLVFKIDTNVPLFFENHEYSFYDYYILNPSEVSNLSNLKETEEVKIIFFGGELTNYKKDFLDKQSLREIKKIINFNK